MKNNETESKVNEDDSEFDIESQDEVEVSIFSRVLRSVVALVVISGLLYISGVYQFFIYQRTSPSVNQAEVVSRVDAQTLSVPLTIFIITGNESYGSIRSEENALHLVENASRIWDQAGITLTIKNIHTISKSDREMKIFLNIYAVFL